MTSQTCLKNLEGLIMIVGEKGTVWVVGVPVNSIEHWEFADKDPDDAKVKDASYGVTSVYRVGHPLYYENLIQALRGAGDADTDGREGLRKLELPIGNYCSPVASGECRSHVSTSVA